MSKKIRFKSNGPINLKEWERDLLQIMDEETNLVFNKIPGAVEASFGVEEHKTPDVMEVEGKNMLETPILHMHAKHVPKNKVFTDETEETKNRNLQELQRLVLLRQLKLINVKLSEREEKKRKRKERRQYRKKRNK